MKAWRNTKVKQRTFDVGDLVLLRSPRIEGYGKLESKWTESYAVTEKSRLGHTTSQTHRVECWSIHGMWTTFIIFTFKQVVERKGLMNYKRAFIIKHIIANLLFDAHILFLIGETRKGVRFLMRHTLCILKP
jgi:hypothetical protein